MSVFALQVESVTHHYGAVPALTKVSLAIKPGEFVTLLGPSGCGKTTLLRILAGFIRPSSGKVFLEGRDVTKLPPHQRAINTVFQRSTLFPHLDVFENVAFGLRLLRRPQAEVSARVQEALALVRLSGFEHRRSHELSGGQLQRVALARALIGRSKVLLLDEPLSALDLAIRLEMEEELRRLHREISGSFVYVTHDQREALALSDRVAVFNQGRLEQIGTPSEIYCKPASPFAARFVGGANVVPVEILAVEDGAAMLELGPHRLTNITQACMVPGPAWLVLRPECIRLGTEGLDGEIRDIAYRGSGFSYRIAVKGLEETINAEVQAERASPLPVGSSTRVSWDPASAIILQRRGK
jgi:ABC-type Fe3+/spermidine/putrescine transport system ATPase subunit